MDAAPLPEGWDVGTSRSIGETYYINSITGESQYDVPNAPATSEVGLGTPPTAEDFEEQMEGNRRESMMNRAGGLMQVGGGVGSATKAATSVTRKAGMATLLATTNAAQAVGSSAAIAGAKERAKE